MSITQFKNTAQVTLQESFPRGRAPRYTGGGDLVDLRGA